MRGGEISNRLAPSIIVIYDDLIARPSQRPEPEPRKIINWPRQNGKQSAQKITWTLDPITVGAINRLVWTTDVNVEIATFTDDLDTITEALDDAHVMYSTLGHTTPNHLAQSLAYAPHVTALYHPYPEHSLTYGPRGRLVKPSQRAQIGQF